MTLKLVISKKPFDVMITGEKLEEFRVPSKWIESRLFDKKGNPREYELIQFTNGYGKDRSTFTAKYKGFTKEHNIKREYSNGLKLEGNEFYVISYHF